MGLADHLQDCLRETALQIGRATPAVRRLCVACQTDPALAADARAHIQAGTAVEPRDHITRWRNSLLRHALGEKDVWNSLSG